MDADARLDAVETENERLRARIDELEALLGMDFLPPVEWRLTTAEARVLGVLMARELATKDAIMAALYRDEGRDEPEIKIVDVFVCKLRKKLAPLGVPVVTRWGVGYLLTAEAKARLRELLDQAVAA